MLFRSCQFHAPNCHKPGVELQVMKGACPFAMWGLDLLGPFPRAPGQLLYAIVAIDYFTKWIKVVPLARTTATEVKKFLWKNVICRFGLPQQIVTDRGPQFNTPIIRSWLEDMGILYTLESTRHAEGNGQVEAANKSIVEDLGKRCMEAKGKWAEYLPLTDRKSVV